MTSLWDTTHRMRLGHFGPSVLCSMASKIFQVGPIMGSSGFLSLHFPKYPINAQFRVRLELCPKALPPVTSLSGMPHQSLCCVLQYYQVSNTSEQCHVPPAMFGVRFSHILHWSFKPRWNLQRSHSFGRLTWASKIVSSAKFHSIKEQHHDILSSWHGGHYRLGPGE